LLVAIVNELHRVRKKLRVPHACGWLLAGCLLGTSLHAEAVTPTGLQARFSKGQVFVTFNEVGGSDITYSVYRSSSPITNVSGLTPVATLTQNSGLNLYTTQRFVVTDLGNPLTPGVGLLVYTSHANGDAYWAVTTSADSTVISGVNTIGPITEALAAVPGAVEINAAHPCPLDSTLTCRSYMAWEDASTWDNTTRGHYGRRFDVAIVGNLVAGQTYPLFLALHGAGFTGYQEPNPWVGDSRSGIYVFPVDLDFSYGGDPYATAVGGAYLATGWFGYDQAGTPELAVSATEQRIVRYTRLIAADPQYQVDPTRIYVMGGSMGGGGALHVGLHHPELFAAVAASLAWIAPRDWGDWSAFANNPTVDTTSGPRWADWQDGAWLVVNQGKLPPVIHTFASDDNIIPPTHYPDMLQKSETYKRAYIAHWQIGGHNVYWLDNNACLARFRLNEPYPAFANASNSNSTSVSQGQRNEKLDWSSSLHDWGAGTQIVDTTNSFAMSFKSLSGDAMADVTVRNAQSFYLRPREVVSWTNTARSGGATLQSGTAQADAQGLLTITSLQITATGNRLTLTCQSCIGPPPPQAPRNLRVVGSSLSQ
jgi:dienelactone hydrolase